MEDQQKNSIFQNYLYSGFGFRKHGIFAPRTDHDLVFEILDFLPVGADRDS